MEWVNPKYFKNNSQLQNSFLTAKPFPHIVLHNFFNTKKINLVAQALLREHFVEQNSDLYQFCQTNDCSKSLNKEIQEFYNFSNSPQFIKLISTITKTKLHAIDMSGFIYSDTDYLLPHDDRLEGRKIAYVVNLSRGFTSKDGGALQLFKRSKVVKTILPSFNTLTLFRVSSESLHQVQEVTSSTKQRVSFAGWFHG